MTQPAPSKTLAISLLGQLVAVVIAVSTLYEVHDAGILTSSFNPAWWVYPALVVAVGISLWSASRITHARTEET